MRIESYIYSLQTVKPAALAVVDLVVDSRIDFELAENKFEYAASKKAYPVLVPVRIDLINTVLPLMHFQHVFQLLMIMFQVPVRKRMHGMVIK